MRFDFRQFVSRLDVVLLIVAWATVAIITIWVALDPATLANLLGV